MKEMTVSDRKRLIKSLYEKHGVEVDYVDETEFKVMDEYAELAVKSYQYYLGR